MGLVVLFGRTDRGRFCVAESLERRFDDHAVARVRTQLINKVPLRIRQAVTVFEEFGDGHLQGAGDLQELGRLNVDFATFVPGDRRLRGFKQYGKFFLGHAGRNAALANTQVRLEFACFVRSSRHVAIVHCRKNGDRNVAA